VIVFLILPFIRYPKKRTNGNTLDITKVL